MSFLKSRNLDLQTVRENKKALEEEYGFGSDKFEADPELRSRVNEDDAIRWSFLIELEESLTRKSERVKKAKPRESAQSDYFPSISVSVLRGVYHRSYEYQFLLQTREDMEQDQLELVA
jgi:hypothetical protein